MEDILPPFVIETLRDHYYAAVTSAEIGFKYSAGDEDSLTGALGQALLSIAPMTVQTPEGTYVWQSTYHKIRGRSYDSPEKRFGADGIFELTVVDLIRGLRRRKGLLFQAKKGWRRRDGRLVKQAQQMVEFEADSIVVDYSLEGYTAFDAADVIDANGKRKGISPSQEMRLSEVLGHSFVRCKRGLVDLQYDPTRELVLRPLVFNDTRVYQGLEVAHASITTVERIE
jgi:hypothetical protein